MFNVDFGVRQGSVVCTVSISICHLCGWFSKTMSVQAWCVDPISLYADDILLIAPSVSELQHLLIICETELDSLDILINVNKSCRLRIGPRSNAPCTSISCTSGGSLPCVEELRHIGVFMKRSRVFKCSLDHAKKRFLSCYKCYICKIRFFLVLGAVHPHPWTDHGQIWQGGADLDRCNAADPAGNDDKSDFQSGQGSKP